MPIPKNATRDQVFHDLRHGKTYARTRRKHGKKAAQRQMIAIAMRYPKKRGGRHSRKRKHHRRRQRRG